MKDCVGFKYVLSGRPINFIARHRDEWERKMSNTKYLNSYEDSTFVHITCNYSRKKLRKILLSNVLKQRQFKTMQGMVILFFFFLFSSSFDSFLGMSPILCPRLPSMDNGCNNRAGAAMVARVSDTIQFLFTSTLRNTKA